MPHYLLDACAVLAFINGEFGREMVLDLLDKAKAGTARLSMSIVQLLEVYYDRVYVVGADAAQIRVESLLAEPITIIEAISYSVMYEAGRFKTIYSMSLADSIAAATAKSINAALVTKDSEMQVPEKAGEFSVLWLK
ncbi:MAG: PIN domain-containing protein [Treponema sp.]|nr:PIN domain-containing protein [Treponema sp.]